MPDNENDTVLIELSNLTAHLSNKLDTEFGTPSPEELELVCVGLEIASIAVNLIRKDMLNQQ